MDSFSLKEEKQNWKEIGTPPPDLYGLDKTEDGELEIEFHIFPALFSKTKLLLVCSKHLFLLQHRLNND